MVIEKIMDNDMVFGDIQNMAPTSLNKKNSCMKMVRIFNPEIGESRSDIFFFEKIKEIWVLNADHCYIAMESLFMDFYMNWISNGEILTIDEFLVKLKFWRNLENK